MELEELKVYRQAQVLANMIFQDVKNWSPLDQRTLGTQLIRAADSVSANIAEGYGRYSRADNRRFLLYARGSLYEVESHISLATQRGIMKKERSDELLSLIRPLIISLKAYGKSLTDTRS